MDLKLKHLHYIEKILSKSKKKFEKLSEEEKEEFNEECLWNPYGDSTILNDTGKEITRIIAGIDIDTSELLLVDRLNEKKQDKQIDFILAHHPVGKGMQGLHGVMAMQADMFALQGVPINIGEGLTGLRAEKIKRAVYPRNSEKTVDAAKLLGISLACTHTVADNHVQMFLDTVMKEKKPETLGEILKVLKEIPEYKESVKHGSDPTIFAGKKDNRAGKIAVSMTGGTSSDKEAYTKLAQAGVGTVIEMHIPEDSRELAKKNHVNVIIAGHMASDSVGMNLLLDNFEKEGIEVLSCSGFIRVKRF